MGDVKFPLPHLFEVYVAACIHSIARHGQDLAYMHSCIPTLAMLIRGRQF